MEYFKDMEKKREKVPKSLFKWLMWLSSKGYETITIQEVIRHIPFYLRK